MSDKNIPLNKNDAVPAQVPAQVPAALVPQWNRFNEMADERGMVTVTNPTPEDQSALDSLFGTQGVMIVEEKPADESAGTPRSVTIQVQREEPTVSATERAAARRQTFAA